MFKKGHVLYAILRGVCPKCHSESMFKVSNPYRIRHVLEMHSHCHNCQTKYQIEPAFFYGAMYVSYAVGIAFATAAFVISYGIFKASINMIFIVIILTLIAFLPIILRLSRSIWINIFIHYDPKASKESTKKPPLKQK